MLCFPCPVTEFACFAFGRGRGKLHPSTFLFHQFSTIHIKTYLPFHLPLPSLSCTPEPSYKDTRAQTRRTLQAARWGRTEEHFVACNFIKLKVSIIAPTLYHCQHTFCQFHAALTVGKGWTVEVWGELGWNFEPLNLSWEQPCSLVASSTLSSLQESGRNLLAYCLKVLSPVHTLPSFLWKCCCPKDIWQGG